MAASKIKNPPHRGPTFLLEFFDTRDCSKKSVFAQRLGWGVAKNERILEKNRFYIFRFFFLTKKVLVFNGKMGQNGQKWPKHGIPKRTKKGQKLHKNALKCVKNMVKMVETTTKYPGKVRACLQNVCIAVCEHGGTAASEKYVFDQLCPFLSIFRSGPRGPSE